ncbi:MAG: hypothetical protein ACLFTK_05325 [Anaerolineales bacterium]
MAKWLLGGLLLALLAACSGGVAPPETIPAGYTVFEGDGVGLGLPPGWQGMRPTADDFRAIASNIAQNNPNMSARLAAMSEDVDDDTVRLIATGPEPLISVNITTEAVPPFWNANAQASQNRDGLQDIGYEIIETGETTLNGQAAALTQAEIAIRQTDGGRVRMRIVQYTLVVGARAYSITFGAPSAWLDDYRAEFQQLAETFHTVD